MFNKIHPGKKEKLKQKSIWIQVIGKACSTFGDPSVESLVIGLVAAAKRWKENKEDIPTGDSSGDWLARASFDILFGNIPGSISKDDEIN